jgi:hypothetical protein
MQIRFHFILNGLSFPVRLVLRVKRREHITPSLEKLHWLPVKQRAIFKILLLAYKALNGMAPAYTCLILSSCISLQGHWDRRHRACCVLHFHHQPSSMVIGLFATLLLRCGTTFHSMFAAPLHLVCLNRDWKRTFSSSTSTQLLCNIAICISCHDVFQLPFTIFFRWNVWQGDVLEPLPFLCFIITIMHILHIISWCNCILMCNYVTFSNYCRVKFWNRSPQSYTCMS